MAVERDDLLDELRRLASELGETPRIRDMDEQGAYSGALYYKYFDSWNAALKEVGLETNQEQDITREALIDDLHDINEKTDEPYPKVDAIREHGTYSLTKYHSEFGGVTGALAAAGIEKPERSPASEEEIIAEIQRVADGSPPTAAQMDSEGNISSRTCSDAFETWNAAVEAAGFDPNNDWEDADRDGLLDEIVRLREELGETPSTADMRDHGKFPPSRYFDNFESWNDAITEAGFTPNEQVLDPEEQRIPESDLLDELHRVADVVDDRPTSHEMIDHGKYSTKPYYNTFGSWNRAIEIAGFTPFTGVSEDIYSTEELLTELRRLESELEKPPTTDGMAENGHMSAHPYLQRFGSWIDALKRAGIEPSEQQLRRHTADQE